MLTNQVPLQIAALSPYGNVFDETDGGGFANDKFYYTINFIYKIW